ncbi:putative Dynein axonemal heavy chain 6 [Blattamonas nauphoetae]|uniref:Dynein axonemal heavy chain 6 n=1 Tax=Blattamonas nauphoetae TaxID=2049346 RepID=A0ABQ9Y411_9EUKA|nr:putative Dynein axonemal heavy chain 6 [Blattamonas nauphoetae]
MKALGMHCIIFNFSEGQDHTSMGRLFSGLAQRGASSCFDEFNQTCGVFVTMHPGYPGRSKLPDNLKALFRSKIDTLYRLSMQQLSRQAHYVWGLRVIKAALVTAERYHRQAPEQTEDVMLFFAYMNMNYPNLLADDLRLSQAPQHDKIVQFSESKDIHHGVMIILAAAKTRLNAAGVPVDANDELFGFYDKTSEWNDGIVTNLVMRAANDESLDEK